MPTLRPTGSRSIRAATIIDEALLSRGVGIKFNGQEKTNVMEYCDFRRLDPRCRRTQPRPLRPADDAQAQRQGRALFRGPAQSEGDEAPRPKDKTATGARAARAIS